MVETGIKGSADLLVTKECSALHIGSGTVPVLATPMMIALMERTCRMSVKPYLEEGQETVGTHVNVSHVAATPLGMSVHCESELVEVDRRRLVFRVQVTDAAGLVVRIPLNRNTGNDNRRGYSIHPCLVQLRDEDGTDSRGDQLPPALRAAGRKACRRPYGICRRDVSPGHLCSLRRPHKTADVKWRRRNSYSTGDGVSSTICRHRRSCLWNR